MNNKIGGFGMADGGSAEEIKTTVYSDIDSTANLEKTEFHIDPIEFWLQVSKRFFEDDFATFTFSVNSTSISLDLFEAQLQVANRKYNRDFELVFEVPEFESNTDIPISLEVKASELKNKLEKFINKLIETNDIDIDWNEIRIFAKINDENFYPIRFEIDSQNKIHIEITEFIADKELYIGSKRQFIYHHYTA